MKLLLAISLALPLFLTGCGGRQDVGSANYSPTPTPTKDALIAPAETPTLTPTPATNNTERPIEFTYLGITPDKQNIHYKIKVITAKPISQVDLGVKYMDEGGNVLDETTLLWQNIVHSKRLPIEQGKTYDVEDYLPPGTTKAEVVLKRVVFADSTYWKAGE